MSDLMTKLMAAIKGEVSAGELEALRGAGSEVYARFTDIEAERKSLAGTDLWNPEPDPRARFATWWRAFACQVLGEAFLDADYEADPRTKGYVPPVTARQVEAFLGEVEVLLHDIRRAENEPSYRPGIIKLPAWVDVDPCPRAHLEAMLKACAVMAEHAELAVADLEHLGADKHAEDYRRLQAMLADVKGDAEYARNLHAGLHGTVSQDMHERVEKAVKRAIGTAYELGQLAAMPGLSKAAPSVPRLPRPGESGFDMWCLTDPSSRAKWKRDRAAVRAIEMLWRYDPDPEATLAIQAQIDAAVKAKDIRASGQGNYFCCPWSAVYQCINPVTLGGKRIRRGKTFTFDVSGEEMAEGGEFKREILVADFRPTTEVDYCNPEEGDDD